VIEESEHYGIIGDFLLSVIAQYRKAGLIVVLIVQTPAFAEHIQHRLFNNTEHVWYGLGDAKTAAFAAEDIGIPTLDPHQVSHYDERTVIRGQVETTLGDRPVFQNVYGQELLARYRLLGDQVLLKQQVLMNLDPGWRFVRGEQGCVLQYVPMLKEPFPCLPKFQKKMIDEAMAAMKARPEYRPIGENAVERWLRSIANIRAELSTRSTTTRRTKRRRGRSTSSASRKGSDISGLFP
jgi:hypothetical protein